MSSYSSFAELAVAARGLSLALAGQADAARLGKRIARATRADPSANGKIRIALLSSFMADLLVDLLLALLLRRGILAEIITGPYGAIATEALDPGQPVWRGADLALLLPTHRNLQHYPGLSGTFASARSAAAQEAASWQPIWAAMPLPIVQLSFDPPPHRAVAELDGFLPGGLLRHVRLTNLALAEAAPSQVTLVDAEALATRLGAAWHDAALYQLCKQPFGADAMLEIADTLASAITGVLGKARKVLVLDLDNTLWGGIVGDAGPDGIVLGPETPEGEAFVAVQTYAKALAERGVILAVCSKNEENNAREPFQSHPAMILSEADIACFVANFEDKATNLRRIAQTLNVGLDSLVFVDDNPAERAWISQELPEVLIVDLPEDPAGYCAAIEREKAFPISHFSAEDRARNASYRSRGQTIAQLGASGDVESFLVGLGQEAAIVPVGPGSVDRIVQLFAKTNQFKLNPILFTATEIEADRSGVFALRFRDRMQDYGITAVAVTVAEGNSLKIVNWVMSCRVFSRRLEHAMLELLRERAARLGLSTISLNYVASPKNGLMLKILQELGFHNADIAGRYVAPVLPGAPGPALHISIIPAAVLETI